MKTFFGRLKRRRWTFLRFFLFIGGAVIFWYVLFYSRFFSVKEIECLEDKTPCSPDVTAELKRHTGENILILRTSVVSEKIQRADATIDRVSVTVKLPHTLKTTVMKRTPVLQMATSPDSPLGWLVDKNGIIVGSAERVIGLPVVIAKGSASLSAGEALPSDLMVASELVVELRDTLDPASPPVVEIDSLTARTKEGSIVRFSLTASPSSQALTLQLVLNKARIDQTRYREIDLRFKEPVVKK